MNITLTSYVCSFHYRVAAFTQKEQAFKYLENKPIALLESEGDELDTQFLEILAAEAEHLVTITISLGYAARTDFERVLNEAFASESFGDSAKEWNHERSRVVEEVMENHLMPHGAKWVREWLRETLEDRLAAVCGIRLAEVIQLLKLVTPSLRTFTET